MNRPLDTVEKVRDWAEFQLVASRNASEQCKGRPSRVFGEVEARVFEVLLNLLPENSA